MRIRFIRPADTHALRHRVLRPHQSIEDCDYPNDRNPESFHVGVFLDERLVGIGSFYSEKHAELKGWKQFRLRGMAVDPDLHGKGIGKKLMDFAMDHLRSAKADLIWCNARENAYGFYERLGFAMHGAPFHIEGIGGHSVMHRRV